MLTRFSPTRVKVRGDYMKCAVCGGTIDGGLSYWKVGNIHICMNCGYETPFSDIARIANIPLTESPTPIEIPTCVGDAEMTPKEVENFFTSAEPAYAGTDSVKVPEIFTGYFAKAKNYPDTITQVSIAQYAPKEYRGYEYKELAPSEKILHDYKKTRNVAMYISSFNQQVLSKKTADDVVADLIMLTHNAKKIVLLCYEKSENFCHRHIVAEWLTQAGYPVVELD